jgi:tRNA threonylcarbamoyladenosine biosynthesis protein TsaE
MKIFITKSAKETQKIGRGLAQKILENRQKEGENKPIVLELIGDLGGGKTTFLQGFALGLGIKEKILSPTFVIMKSFKSKKNNDFVFYHMDSYRLKNSKDALQVGLKDILRNPNTIIAIEWAEKIKPILPKNNIKINFIFLEKNKRKLLLNIPYTIR